MPTSTAESSTLAAAVQQTSTVLWNDSADLSELAKSIEFGAVGATCNPVIAVTVIENNLSAWGPRIQALAAEHPYMGDSEIGWLAVERMSVEAAELLRPAFAASGGRNGRLSIQTDPRLHRNATALVAQADRFSRLANNIIVKIPATSQGLVAIEEATYRGISVNVTVSFTVAQAVASAEAIERGLTRRAAEGLTTPELGSVVTLMAGRLDDWLKQWCNQHRLLVEPGVLDWAGIAALKRAHGLFRDRGFHSRILSAAFRSHLQWTELVGGDLVISPPIDWQARINENGLSAEARIDRPVDKHVLDELHKLSEFRRSYEVDGLMPEEFDTFGATRATLRQFLDANARLESLVRDVLIEP